MKNKEKLMWKLISYYPMFSRDVWVTSELMCTFYTSIRLSTFIDKNNSKTFSTEVWHVVEIFIIIL